MKKNLVGIITVLALLGMAGMAHAHLITIGTATFNGTNYYNLIWDDDNNGNSVVWLDYTKGVANWSDQNDWAEGLNLALTDYNIYAAYTVDWGTNDWRLPDTEDGPWVYGNNGTTTAGYNITSSEMGHLFYEKLDNLGLFDTSGNELQLGHGLQNTGDFLNLNACDLDGCIYWSGTEYAVNSANAWYFSMHDGLQGTYDKDGLNYGLAVRSGEVSETNPVPAPATILLFSTGLAGLAGLKRWRKGNRV